ncbi:MAG: antitoxin Xre/MbcA/ParS toxin-binding domain-containing protein [Aquimonas sp.]
MAVRTRAPATVAKPPTTSTRRHGVREFAAAEPGSSPSPALSQSPLARHAQLGRRVPRQVMLQLIDTLPGDVPARLQAVGLGEASLKRFRAQPRQPLSEEHAERTLEISRLVQMAREVLGSVEAADTWLATSQRALDFQLPRALLRTAPGRMAVEQLLGRIEYGVYS